MATISLQIPAGSIRNADIADSAGIASTKLGHRRNITAYANPTATAVSATVVPCFQLYGTTGTIVGVSASLAAVCTGSDTVSVQIKKNGSNLLASAIAFTVADSTPYAAKTGTPTSSSLVAGDFLEVSITIPVSNTTGKGIIVRLVIDEDAA